MPYAAKLIRPPQRQRVVKTTLLGELWQCRSRSGKGSMAVKVSRHALMQAGARENAVAEADILRLLCRGGGHENICNILRAPVSAGGCMYMECEWCDGGELLDYVQSRRAVGRALSEDEARHAFRQLVDAVAFMHARDVCHLDLSAENIMLVEKPAAPAGSDRSALAATTASSSAAAVASSSSPAAAAGATATATPAAAAGSAAVRLRLKIIDFGLARAGCVPGTMLRGHPNPPGKVGYMSPEMFAGCNFSPHAADIYALGVILFMLHTGSAPYRQDAPKGGPHLRALGSDHDDPNIARIWSGRLAELLAHWRLLPGLSHELVDLLQSLLAPPDRRLNLAALQAHPWMNPHSAAAASAASADNASDGSATALSPTAASSSSSASAASASGACARCRASVAGDMSVASASASEALDAELAVRALRFESDGQHSPPARENSARQRKRSRIGQ